MKITVQFDLECHEDQFHDDQFRDDSVVQLVQEIANKMGITVSNVSILAIHIRPSPSFFKWPREETRGH